MKKKRDYLILKIIIGVAVGIVLGMLIKQTSGVAEEHSMSTQHVIMNFVISIKHIIGQIIFFMVPLVIIGFITPAIVKMKNNANKMLIAVLILAYISSLSASVFAMVAGYVIIPHLNIVSDASKLLDLPEMIFKLDIEPLFPVITSLFLAITFGLAVSYTKSLTLEKMFLELHDIVMLLVNKLVIPILPIFILMTFIELTYTGLLTEQFPAFFKMIAIILVGHILWLIILYLVGGLIARQNPLKVIKYYFPAYFTAVGTMSSAATLPIALKCANKSEVLNKEVANFTLSICSTIHLSGSVITETFFVMGISYLLEGSIPSLSTMIIFIVLLGIFAIGAPGVPGGTVMASVGILVSVLGFGDTGIALAMVIYALQDSFGTACNITGDGAIALMLQGIFKKKPGDEPDETAA